MDRPLRESDLVLLQTSAAVQPITLKKVTQRHHSLARLLASGVAPGEAAAITGYDNARVSVLQGDPAFRELVEFYTERANEVFRDTLEQVSGLSQDVIAEIRDRLEDDPASFTNTELRQLLEGTLDRSGHGPRSTQVQEININLASRLDEARRRAREARRQAIIDITPDD